MTCCILLSVASLWTEDEGLEFFVWLAGNPEAGDVIPESGGCRKVRWSRAGTGKRGGVRVSYFTRLPAGEIWLLVVYAKSVTATIPGQLLKAIRKEIENAWSNSSEARFCWRGTWPQASSIRSRNETHSDSVAPTVNLFSEFPAWSRADLDYATLHRGYGWSRGS